METGERNEEWEREGCKGFSSKEYITFGKKKTVTMARWRARSGDGNEQHRILVTIRATLSHYVIILHYPHMFHNQ